MSTRLIAHVLFSALAASAFANSGAPRVDQPLPGGKGGSLTIHVEAGRRGRDFHVTFERAGIGQYVYFDGTNWTALQPVTKSPPFRSGVHLAIDRSNKAHLAWVEGSGDRAGTVYYRTVRDGTPGAIETVHAPQGWNECDIAVDEAGHPVIAANTTTQSELAVYDRSSNGWTATLLPSDNTHHKWAPSIVFAAEGLLFVASRRKDAHPFTWWVRDSGVWTKDAKLPARSYEPNAIPHGAGIIASSMDGYVYVVEKRGRNFETSHRDVRAMKRGVIRGQHVGIGRTSGGTLVLSHSDMTNAESKERTIGAGHRFYYTFSRDGGQTWTLNQPVAKDPGQGHGNMAVNDEWVMLVWSDIRNGAHVRYSLIRDPGMVTP